MNQENFKKFVDALRSGDFPQARGTLNRTSKPNYITNVEGTDAESLYVKDNENTLGYCCLGVVCELAVRDGVIRKEGFSDGDGERRTIFGLPDDDSTSLSDSTEASYTFLPAGAATWLGLPEQQNDLFFDMTDTRIDNEDLPQWILMTKNRYGKLVVRASDLNDRFGFTFAEIADLLEGDRLIPFEDLPASFH